MKSLFDQNESLPAAASSGWTTAHCDGGARGNPGPAGYGAVLTDASGHKLAELSEFLGIASNNVAEYRGLLGVLEYALAHGLTRLRVISDSLLMVHQINGRYKVASPDLKPLWQEAKRRIAQLEGFEITHALRHKNKDADRLANEAMDRGTGRAPAAPSRPPSPGNPAAARPRASSQPASAPSAAPQESSPSTMLRGFVRDGAVHLLGNAHLPDGVFVKIIPE